MKVHDPSNILDTLDSLIYLKPFKEAFIKGDKRYVEDKTTQFKESSLIDRSFGKLEIEISEVNDKEVKYTYKDEAGNIVTKDTILKADYENSSGNALRDYFSKPKEFKIPNANGQDKTEIVIRELRSVGSNYLVDTFVKQEFPHGLGESRIEYTINPNEFGNFQFIEIKTDMGRAWSKEVISK